MILDVVAPRISIEHNEQLLLPFTGDEIKEAFWSMHQNNSPGPDGMYPTFFQSFWQTVGDDVIASYLNFLNNCSLPIGLNDTTIVLILKKIAQNSSQT